MNLASDVPPVVDNFGLILVIFLISILYHKCGFVRLS